MSPHARPLKVLHILSGDLWAGAEVQAFNLLAALRRTEHVEVAAALLNDGELAARLRAIGVRTHVFDEARLNGLQILMALRTFMRDWRPDVVHTHRTKENVLGSLANRFSGAAPCLRTAHGAPEHAPRGLLQPHKKLFHLLDRWSGAYLQEATIAVTGDLAAKLRSRPNKTVVIENGIDVHALAHVKQPAGFREQNPGATHVGIVGRLVPVKRVDLFLAMAALLRAREPERAWRFHVFGDGPLREPLGRLATEAGIDEVVTFHGHRADIAANIAGLDTLVMCSDHEGLPMTLLEAMTLGTPVVGHAVGGIAQLLDDDRCGWLVREHNAAGYARAVQAALAQSGPRSERAETARDAVARRYSAAHCAQQHLNLYRRLTA